MDARGQPVPATTRPRYPHLPASTSASHSVPSSAFNSSSSVASLAPGSAQQSSLIPPGYAANSAAPLPSPSRELQGSGYFGSGPGPAPAPAHNGFGQRSSQGQSCGVAAGQTYVGQRGDGSGAPVTAPFLKDFNLVAEAAKRAQMACLTRDLDDVGL